ncbi:MAG TPA: HNH endonuclease signature motif containing protein [Anaerolineales bacterium]|nr:HNH endonuclease signature motif containing protein [Anaerolineales bacterium]
MQQYEAWAVDSDAFRAGCVIGGLATIAQGIGEVGAGLTAVGGGGLFCAATAGGGCLLGGGEAVMVGAGVAVHGTSAVVAGAAEAGQQLGIVFAKKSKYNEPPTGERGSFSKTTKETVDNSICPYCGKKIPPDSPLDHIVAWTKEKLNARSRGDELDIYTNPDNLTRACPTCNSRKRDKSLLQFMLEMLDKRK